MKVENPYPDGIAVGGGSGRRRGEQPGSSTGEAAAGRRVRLSDRQPGGSIAGSQCGSGGVRRSQPGGEKVMPESLTTSQTAPAEPEMSAAEIEWIDRSLIDESVRTPVMFFFTTAQTWLLAATVIGFICSIKLHWPSFLGNWSFLTYGRLWPAYTNILVYGWGSAGGDRHGDLDDGAPLPRGIAGAMDPDHQRHFLEYRRHGGSDRGAGGEHAAV